MHVWPPHMPIGASEVIELPLSSASCVNWRTWPAASVYVAVAPAAAAAHPGAADDRDARLDRDVRGVLLRDELEERLATRCRRCRSRSSGGAPSPTRRRAT